MSLHSSLSAPGCRIHPHIWEEKQLRTHLLRKGHWRGPVSLCGLKGAQQIGSPNEIVGPLLPAELRPPGGPRPEARGSPPCALNLAKLYQSWERPPESPGRAGAHEARGKPSPAAPGSAAQVEPARLRWARVRARASAAPGREGGEAAPGAG